MQNTNFLRNQWVIQLIRWQVLAFVNHLSNPVWQFSRRLLMHEIYVSLIFPKPPKVWVYLKNVTFFIKYVKNFYTFLQKVINLKIDIKDRKSFYCWDINSHPGRLHSFNLDKPGIWKDPSASLILTSHNSCDFTQPMPGTQ